MPRPLIHIHVKRTGGSSLGDMVRGVYPNGVARAHQSFSPEKDDRVKLFQGHFCYGVHARLEVPPRYIAILRHPIDRYISMIYGTQPYDDDLLKVHQFIGRGGEFATPFEAQVLQISGIDQTDQWAERRTVTRDDLNLALSNLDTFEAVGFLEYFEASVNLISKIDDWKLGEIIKVNCNPRPQPRPSNKSEMYRLISEFVKFEMELYEIALDRYYKRLEI